MKIKVIKNTYYNLEYIKATEGRIIEYKGDKVPSWGELVKEKTKNKTTQNNPEGKSDENKIPVEKETNNNLNEIEKQQYLELLINEAMDKNILIEDADKKTNDEQIAELEAKLGKGGK